MYRSSPLSSPRAAERAVGGDQEALLHENTAPPSGQTPPEGGPGVGGQQQRPSLEIPFTEIMVRRLRAAGGLCVAAVTGEHLSMVPPTPPPPLPGPPLAPRSGAYPPAPAPSSGHGSAQRSFRSFVIRSHHIDDIALMAEARVQRAAACHFLGALLNPPRASTPSRFLPPAGSILLALLAALVLLPYSGAQTPPLTEVSQYHSGWGIHVTAILPGRLNLNRLISCNNITPRKTSGHSLAHQQMSEAILQARRFGSLGGWRRGRVDHSRGERPRWRRCRWQRTRARRQAAPPLVAGADGGASRAQGVPPPAWLLPNLPNMPPPHI